jgi:hypothetical protein
MVCTVDLPRGSEHLEPLALAEKDPLTVRAEDDVAFEPGLVPAVEVEGHLVVGNMAGHVERGDDGGEYTVK